MMNGMCKCSHHKIVPVLIVLIGLLFLLNAFGSLSAGMLAVLWPIALILIGLQKMFGAMCKCCGGHACSGAGCPVCAGEKKPMMGDEKKM